MSEEIKLLSRNPAHFIRQTKTELHPISRNVKSHVNPFEVVREYQRALNATKLERVFAKPFVGSLDGHTDGVSIITKNPLKLNRLWSGAQDGEIRHWDLTAKKCIKKIKAHDGWVRGLTMTRSNKVISVGVDKMIKIWDSDEFNEENSIISIVGSSPFTSVDSANEDSNYATSSGVVDYWDITKSDPIRTWKWGHDTYNRVRFNPIEKDLLCSTVSDRSIVLYDVRAPTPMKKVTLSMQSNGISWNPQEAMIFTVANEDNNLYSFDLRNLDSAFQIHVDHVDAVLDVDWSPTGKELVSASYDRTIRIFPQGQNRSREVYHVKRMQRVFSVAFSGDSRFLMCGSDEGNIRMWKSVAWRKEGNLNFRQRASQNYADKLKQKFKHHPEIKRIARHRHVPKNIYKGTRRQKEMLDSQKRKEDNRRKHSKPGSVPVVAKADAVISQKHE